MDRFVEQLPLTREATTIAFVDVAESVRHVLLGEAQAVQRIRALLAEAARDTVPAHGGRVIERQGDGLLLRFDLADDAARCAIGLQALAARHAQAAAGGAAADGGAPDPGPAPLALRIGLHRAEVLTDQSALYGVGVNMAARIAALGQPGDILMSSAVRDGLALGVACDAQDLGDCFLKHIDAPVRLFRLLAAVAPLPAALHQAIGARLAMRPTLVVLPTLGLPGGALPRRGADLADVLTDQLSAQFCRSPLLHVISALSAQVWRDREVDMALVYRTWHAQYVLRASLLAAPPAGSATGRVRLQFELWRAGADAPIEQQAVEGTANDALSADSELIGRVVHAVCSRILAVEQRAVRAAARLPNLASHTLYLNAVDLLHRFALADFERARALLLAVAERAPRHAEPLAWLARWHVFKVVQGWTADARRDGLQALAYSQQALDRDPQSALALTMAGSVKAGVQRDPAAAQRLYDQALAVNPNEPLAWLMSSVARGFLTEREPALAASETALGLAPVDPMRHYYDSLAATASVMAGAFDRAEQLARRCLLANATHGSAYRALAIAQVMQGRVAEARLTIDRLLAVEPHCTVDTYLARVAPANAQNLLFAQALRQAGLPAH